MPTLMSLVEAAETVFDENREGLADIAGTGVVLKRVDGTGLGDHGRYCIRTRDGEDVACFVIEQMPSCTGAAMLRGFEVKTRFRGRGLGSAVLRTWHEAVRRAGRRMCMATALADNAGQTALLTKFDWCPVETYTIDETGERVTLWIRNLGGER